MTALSPVPREDVRILVGDVRDRLRDLEDESVHCVVTSPPYFRLRDYEMPGQIGHEATPEGFADALSAVFLDLRRVIRSDGVLWLQLGDSYAAGGNGGGGSLARRRRHWRGALTRKGRRAAPPGYQPKDILSTPFLVADCMRSAGWIHRATIVWDKTLASEPFRIDRPPSSHEYLFLLAKSPRSRVRDPGEHWFRTSVWQIKPQRVALDHPAVMPAELARRCIVCSTAPGDMVLDPFGGSGTTAMVANGLGRNAILIELNPTYAAIAEQRTRPAPMFASADDSKTLGNGTPQRAAVLGTAETSSHGPAAANYEEG